MKKNFVKKLAMGLAFTMVVTMLPTSDLTADAAAKVKFKTYYGNVYSGKTYSYTVKNIKKGYKVKYSVSGTAKAAVKLSKTQTKKATGSTATFKITVTASKTTANKTATVKATVYNTKGKKVGSKSDKITIKADAKDVTIKTDKFDTAAMVVNEKYDLDRTLDPAYSTNKTYWSVDNTEKASIDSKGVFTAKEAGTYKVTATVKRSKGAATVRATKEIELTVKKSVLKDAKQTAIRKIALNFAGSVADVKATDITISNSVTNVVVPVKSVSVDGTTVNVETNTDMTDGQVFNVVCGEEKVSFTATDGKVADLKLNKTEIPYDKETEIQLIAVDATGIELKAIPYGNSEVGYDFEITTSDGQISGSKLKLDAVGKTATAKVAYHTYKYENGSEVGAISKEFTITAVEQAAITSYEKFTIDKKAPADWSTVTENKTVAVGENSANKVYLYAKDANGAVVVNGDPSASKNGGYTIESSNEDIIIMNNNEINAVKAGSAYVIIKKDNKVIWSLPVTVVASRAAKSLQLSGNSFTVSNSTPAAQKVELTVSAKDQYGKDMPELTAADYTVECTVAPSTPGKASVVAGTYYKVEDNKIVFYGTESGATTTSIGIGRYQYKITLTKDDAKVIQYVTVNVTKPSDSGAESYKLILSKNKIDTTVKGQTIEDNDYAITIQLGHYKGNTLVGYLKVSSASLEIQKGGKRVATIAAITDAGQCATNESGANVATFQAMHLDSSSKSIAKADKGTYTVTAKGLPELNGKAISTNFTISDAQPSLTVSRTFTDLSAEGLGTATDAAFRALMFKYNGSILDKAGVEDESDAKQTEENPSNTITNEVAKFKLTDSTAPVTNSEGKNSFAVKKVKVWVPVAHENFGISGDTNETTVYYVPMEVSVGATVTY